VFFAPVGYAAYIFGVTGAVLTALISGLILLPYAMLTGSYPDAAFGPTAFGIILSAVGAAVAMLQKSDEQRRRSTNELKCLYDVGQAAEGSSSIDDFLASVVELVPLAMRPPDELQVRVAVRGRVLQSPHFEDSSRQVVEDVTVGSEVLGKVEICCAHRCPSLKKRYLFLHKQCPFVGALAERISGAVRRIELEQSLKCYSEELQEMVKERTRDLEQAQDKLIRSERLAAVGELASGVGHELRNPLNVIRNCVYLLNMTLADEDDDSTLSTLKLLDQQVDIGNKIVTDLLDFTRIRPPCLTRVNLNSLVEQSLSWVPVPENVDVTCDFNGNGTLVLADAEQVGRAFANIIANALQSLNGKGDVNISTRVDDGYAWVRFSDTGCGIPEENLDKIFEPLFTTKPKGIGLGLAITARLIEQNGGAIEVVSQVGKGATFSVRLPVSMEETVKETV
jgi:signal transduction histidine kinase